MLCNVARKKKSLSPVPKRKKLIPWPVNTRGCSGSAWPSSQGPSKTGVTRFNLGFQTAFARVVGGEG